jgi:hypothetical protein
MGSRTRLAIAAAVAALTLALTPVAAPAHPNPSPATVKEHVRNANHALANVVNAVQRNHDGAAADQLAEVLSEIRAAAREARKLRWHAHGVQEHNRAAVATRAVTSAYTRNAKTFASIVDLAGGRTQVEIAQALNSSLRGRDASLSSLAGLIDEISPRLQTIIATAIASLTQEGQGIVTDILSALESGTPPDVDQLLLRAVSLATAGIDLAVDILNLIAEIVPAPVQPLVQNVLGLVTSQLDFVTGLLQTFLGGGGDGGLPGPGFICGLPFLGGFLPFC